jgi:AraC-like DNA-binding protein
MDPVADRARAEPAAPLRGLVQRYVGYRYEGLTPGRHIGLPSPWLTLIISLGAPTRLAVMPDPAQRSAEFTSLIGGLHTRPAVIAHSGDLFGVQVDLTPAGARSVLGIPAGSLGPLIVRLADVLGSDAEELVEGMATASSWPARFEMLDTVLDRRAGQIAQADAPLARAWNLIMETGGTIRVSQVASEVGWSRRQLSERFVREYGLTVKDAARVIRFHKSRLLIQHRAELTIAAAAAASGYYDQAHLAREWRMLAGCPPSTWVANEEIPFFQDTDNQEGGD